MRRRLVVSTLGIALTLVLVLGVPLAFLVDRVVHDEAVSRLTRQAQAVAVALDEPLRAGAALTPDMLSGLVSSGDRVVVRSSSGTISSGDEVKGRSITAEVNGPGGSSIRLQTGAQSVDRRVRRALLTLEAIAALALAAAVGLALWQATRLARPLDDLASVAGRLGSGDFSARAAATGIPEADQIVEALNRSGAQIAALVDGERQFSANASHQLRTPLTGIQLRLEELAMSPDPETREEAEAALVQAARLSSTIDELLSLARAERVQTTGAIDLSTLVGDHLEGWTPLLKRSGRTVAVDVEPGVVVQATAGALGQVLDVLLDNALRHGRGAVHLEAQAVADHAVVTVRDEGAGIPPEVVPNLFSRHATGNRAGNGIGLSLARTLTEADGGRLELVRPRPATFRLVLPLAVTPKEARDGSPGEAAPPRSSPASR